jgi:hypothetical protein
VVSGGVLCVIGCIVAAIALPAFRAYDAKVYHARDSAAGIVKRETVSTEQVLVLIAAAARPGRVLRDPRRLVGPPCHEAFDPATKPVPTSCSAKRLWASVEPEVENLGGTLAAGGIIVHVSDELRRRADPSRQGAATAHLAAVRRQAWKRQLEPQCLVLIARDTTGRCWDYVDGGKQVRTRGAG